MVWGGLSLDCNAKLKYPWRLAGTRAAVFAAGVDGVDHHRCFQFTDALMKISVSLGIGSYGVHDGDRLRRQFP